MWNTAIYVLYKFEDHSKRVRMLFRTEQKSTYGALQCLDSELFIYTHPDENEHFKVFIERLELLLNCKLFILSKDRK